jgi:dolichyl-phosphate beta-glucosyltransferase
VSERLRPGEPHSPWLEIIIPAKDEEGRLPVGLTRLCEKAATLPDGVAIIVVDSASTDDTAGIVRRWPQGKVPVRLVSCTRSGKGAAVRAGLLASAAPYVGFCDADMAADLSAIDDAIRLLREGRPMVLGSRAHPESVVEDRHSILRRAGAALFRAAARLITPAVTDTQCGLKFFAGPVARAAAYGMCATGFAFDIELIARCCRLGAQPTEIPVTWQDVPGSTFSVLRHSLAAFTEVGAIWLALRSPSAMPPDLAEAAAEVISSSGLNGRALSSSNAAAAADATGSDIGTDGAGQVSPEPAARQPSFGHWLSDS